MQGSTTVTVQFVFSEANPSMFNVEFNRSKSMIFFSRGALQFLNCSAFCFVRMTFINT